MKGIIEIEDMEFFAYHGCFEAEQMVGNKFVVNACLHYACDNSARSDQITDALSYQTAYEIIAQEMMTPSHLLEHVGKRILDALYENTDVSTARWLSFPDELTQKQFMDEQASRLARDADGNLVYLATSIYNLQTTQKHWPQVQFHTTREKNQNFS